MVNITMINMCKLLCCFKHSLYQLCHRVVSFVILDRSFNHFGSQFFILLNDRLDEYNIAKVFSGSSIVRSQHGSEGQEHSLINGV